MRWLGLPARPRLSAEQYSAFLVSRAPLRTRMLQAAVLYVLVFYLGCFFFDLWLLGDVTWLSATLRFGLMLPIAIGLMVYINGEHPVETKEVAAILVALLANICWCVILLSSHNPAVLSYYYAACTFQMAITIAAASPFRPSLNASIFGFCLT
ncbi:MAG: GGDEF domain-containing protein, partial [Allorhizobium sp.]